MATCTPARSAGCGTSTMWPTCIVSGSARRLSERSNSLERMRMGDDQLETKIMGTPVSIKGIGAIVVVVLAVALIGAGWLLMDASRQSLKLTEKLAASHAEDMKAMAERNTREHDTLVDVLNVLKTVNENISKAIDEQSFIILASEKEQADMKTRLRMPDSLRIKLLQNGSYGR
jgi:hypothetical protein